MDRYWEANSVTQPPAVPASSDGGFPSDGSLVASVAPTTPGAWWYHSITEELRNAIVALGASPEFTQIDQLATALLAALAHTAVSIHFDDLIGAPQLAAVASSGSFTDLSNAPLIQPPLGFTHVQQGTGAGQLANTVRIGWDGGGLRATVDASDEGRFVFEAELADNFSNLQNQINGKQPAGDFLTINMGYDNVGSLSICSNPAWAGLGQAVVGVNIQGAAGSSAVGGTWVSLGLVSLVGSTQWFLAQRIG